MLYADFKARTQKWNQFSQVDTLGAFDFYTAIVSLDALRAEDVSQLLAAFDIAGGALETPENLTPDQYHQLAKIIPLAFHEYTHFIDATSTVWGLRHLNLMNEAYLSDDRNGSDEKTFFKAKRFYDHVRGLRLPNYYTVVDYSQPDLRPWWSDISIGRLFSADGTPSKRPVIFSRFSNRDRELLARSPISPVSLLEATAMAQEVLSHALLINRTETDFRLVEQSQFQSKTLDHIYNPAITEYSVCVHVLANRQGCADVAQAFTLCAGLSRMVLNCPESIFRRIAEVCPVSEILRVPKGHDMARAATDALETENLGVLYYLLCNALPQGSYQNPAAAKQGIRSAIAALGVDYRLFEQEARGRAKELFTTTVSTSIECLSALSKAGYENFAQLELDTIALPFPKLNLPPAFLGDSSQMQIFPSQHNSLRGFDLEFCFSQLNRGQSWVERFSEACL